MNYLAIAITILLIPLFWHVLTAILPFFIPWCLQKTQNTPFCTYRCQRIQSPNVGNCPNLQALLPGVIDGKSRQVLGCPTHRIPSAALCGMWAIAMGCRSGALSDSRREICSRTTIHLNYFKLSICFFSARTFGCAWCMAMPCFEILLRSLQDPNMRGTIVNQRMIMKQLQQEFDEVPGCS